jgi:hypothetical protein
LPHRNASAIWRPENQISRAEILRQASKSKSYLERSENYDLVKIWMHPESVDASGTEKTHKGKRNTWLRSHLFPVEFTA